MSDNMITRDPFITPFIEWQLSLNGAKAPEGRFPSYMRLDFKAGKSNNIDMSFGSGVYGEDGKQKTISLSIPAYTFAVLTQQAIDVGAKDPGFEFHGLKINGVRQRKPGDDSKGTPTGWDGTVFIGKDSQGVCYICGMSKAAGKIKIPFQPDPKWVNVVDVRTNEPAPLAVVSCEWAAGWGRTLLPIVGQLMVKFPFDFKNKDGGGGGGNDKWAGKNGGGGWKDRPQGQSQQQKPSGGGDMDFMDMGGGKNSFDDDVMM